MMSLPETSSGNDRRHLFVINEDYASAIAVWRSQARDYPLKHKNNDPNVGESFTTHVRHYFVKADHVRDLHRIWNHFSST